MSLVTCKFCKVKCTSLVDLCAHVVGHKHRMLVAEDFPGTVEELGRLQYFIDTYTEDWPVLGLNYVLETQTSSSYHYSCTLCKKELDWKSMAVHIFDTSHMENYISRHHSALLDRKYYGMSKREKYLRLQKYARDMQLNHGCKKIRTKESDTSDLLPAKAGTSHEECSKANGAHLGPSQGKELATEGSKGNSVIPTVPVHHCSLCGVDSMTFVALSKHVMSAQHRQHVKDMKPNMNKTSCFLCGIACTSFRVLSEHVTGKKHKMKMEQSGHSERWKCDRLGHFLDAFMTEEPILGLEYIVESNLYSYQYNCKLCKVDGSMPKMVSHLKDLNHMKCYLQQNHIDMLKDFKDLPLKDLPKEEFCRLVKELEEIALKILDREWCEVYGTSVTGDRYWREDSTSKSNDLPSSRHDGGKSSQYQSRTLPHLEENHSNYGFRTTLTQPAIDGPSLAKRKRLLPKQHFKALSSTPHAYKDPHYDESHTMDLQVTPAMEELEFHNNQQFFEYLANFKIRDYNDVVLIQKITQNCIGALKRFQKEELEAERLTLGHERSASVANTSRVDQEILDTSVKPKSPPLSSKTIWPKDTFNTPLELPKNKVTDDFFSGIKNMDESEVVSFFQKIASTNPAFQGMDIPAVIRYLKASGRLNKP